MNELIKKYTLGATIGIACMLGLSIPAKASLYLGVEGGWDQKDTKGDWKGSKFGGGAFIGYDFRFSPNFYLGTEVAFDYLGSLDNSALNQDNEVYQLAAFVTANYRNQGMGLYLKGGYGEQYFTGDSFMSDGWSNDGTFIAGLGIEYNISPNWIAGLEYLHGFGKDTNDFIDSDGHADALSYDRAYARIKYQF